MSENTKPNYYVNCFMIDVLRGWVHAGSGDEWGEYLGSMLDTAESVSSAYDDVSDYLWRQVLSEIPAFVFEFWPAWGEDYQHDDMVSAVDSFPLHLEKALDHAWNAGLKASVQEAADTLPGFMKDKTLLPELR